MIIFTSCLPSPQKGPDVLIPVAQAGSYPVVTGDTVPYSKFPQALSWQSRTGENIFAPASGGYQSVGYSIGVSKNAQGSATSSASPTGIATENNISYGRDVVPANLWAVSDGNAASATINQLRMAFQIQKLYEKDARGGSRYIEILKSHFGVTSPDARLQRPEYLGGNRIPININQVVQQSATASGATAQGTVTGMSVTTDTHSDFTKSFTEHGFVLGVMVARYDHPYQ